MPTIPIRWSENTSQLTAALKLGLNQIEATRAGAEKMAQALGGGKLIEAAHNWTAAVQLMGGAEKLISGERERGNALLTKAIEKYTALGQVAPQAMRDPAAATKGVSEAAGAGGGAFATFGQQVLASAAGFVSAQAIMSLAAGAIKGLGRELQTLTLHGAAVADVSENFTRLTAQAGLLGSGLLGTLRAGTHATITDFELMKTVNQDLAAGMNLTDQQFGTLAKGAFALAQATGTDVKTAFDTMNDAMLTGRTRALALLTGKVDLEAAEQKYAASLGTTANQLTEEQKLEAARAGILEKVSEATARLGEQTDGLDEKFAQAQTAWTNFENALGQSIATSSSLGVGLDALQTSLVDAFGGNQAALIQQITQAVEAAARVMVDLGLATIEMARVVHVAWSAVSTGVLGTITGIIKAAEAMLATIAVVAKVGEAFGQVQKGTSQWATNLRQDLKGVSDSLAAQTREAARGVVGLSALDQKFDAMGGALLRVKDALSATLEETTAFVGPLQANADGHKKAGDAADEHGKKVKQSGKEATAAAEAFKALLSQLTAIEGATPTLTIVSLSTALESVGTTGNAAKEVVETLGTLSLRSASDIDRLRGSIDTLQRSGRFLSVAMIDVNKQIGVLPTVTSQFGDEIKEIREGVEEVVVLDQDWLEGLDALAGAFTQLAQVGGDSFGGIVKDIGKIVGAMNMAAKSAKQFKEAMNREGGADKMGMVTGGIGMATAMWSATSHKAGNDGLGHMDKKSTMQNVAGGAMAGAAIGSFAGPYGAAVGMAIGAVVGLARSWHKVGEAEKEARKEVETFSAAIRATLNAQQRAEAGGEQWKMTVIGIRDAYLAAGLSAADADAAVHALWDAAARGPEAVKEVEAAIQSVIDHNTAMVDAIHGMGFATQEELQGVADTATDVYEYMLRTGKYTAEQLALAFEQSALAQRVALGDADAIAQDQAARAGFKTRDELERTAAKAVATYEYMRDSGLYTAAEIQRAFEAANAATVDGLGGVTGALTQLDARLKSLNESVSKEAPEKVMGVIEARARAEIAALEAQKKAQQDAAKAAAQMPPIEVKTTIDVQPVIDKIRTIPAAEIPVLFTDVDAQREMLKHEADGAVDDFEDAFGHMRVQPIHIPVVFDAGPLPTYGGPSGGGEAPERVSGNNELYARSRYAATGGRVTATGIQHFIGGGTVLPFPTLGTDTVPAMLTPGELILNVPQQQRVAGLLEAGVRTAQAITAPAARSGEAGGDGEFHIHIYQDGKETAHQTLKAINAGGTNYEQMSRLVRRIVTERKVG